MIVDSLTRSRDASVSVEKKLSVAFAFAQVLSLGFVRVYIVYSQRFDDFEGLIYLCEELPAEARQARIIEFLKYNAPMSQLF